MKKLQFDIGRVVCRYIHNWKQPVPSVDSGLKIYNPTVKRKVPLCTNKDSFMSWYSCGPTVYDATHIGHASSYVRLDIIQRVLKEWFGKQPIIALGITDIDDKIIAKSRETSQSCSEISKKYELEFFNAMDSLNILRPHFILRVTEHVPEIISFVEGILRLGHGYVLPDGSVYFNVKSLPSYGKITNAPVLEDVKPAEEGRRRHPADFALWKSSKPDEPSWPSPWGPGRPGWHIECSAMASKIFGRTLDVHAGGLDLAFPHHENEEAQCCAFHETDQWVNYWIHTGHLLMNGMKMSKSMKNFVPVTTFLETYTADDLRMMCLMTHYRSGIDYTNDVMRKAEAMRKKFETFLGDARNYCSGSWSRGNVSGSALLKLLRSTKEEIRNCLVDDLNTAQCINLLEALVKSATAMLHAEPVGGSGRDVAEVAVTAQFVQDCLCSLGLLQSQKEESGTGTMDHIIEKTVRFRSEVRLAAKSTSDKKLRGDLLQACDTIRDDLKLANVIVKDVDDGYSWTRK